LAQSFIQRGQIEWFKAGGALNLIAASFQRSAVSKSLPPWREKEYKETSDEEETGSEKIGCKEKIVKTKKVNRKTLRKQNRL